MFNVLKLFFTFQNDIESKSLMIKNMT